MGPNNFVWWLHVCLFVIFGYELWYLCRTWHFNCAFMIFFYSDVKLATKNKVPSVRSLTLTWVTSSIETSPKAVVLKLHKDYIPILMEVGISMDVYVSLRHANSCICIYIFFVCISLTTNALSFSFLDRV